MMTDTPVPLAPTDGAVAEVTASTEQISLKDTNNEEHVHDENCQHDHGEEDAAATEPQGRNDYDLLEIRGTKDKTADPLVKVTKKYFITIMRQCYS